jgi:small-conductance mechanosensitive channel
MKAGGFILRWLFAILIVLITYNPTHYSLFHWLIPFENVQLPLKILASLVMLVIYIIFIRATFRSIGVLGIILATAVSSTIVWLFIDQGWMSLENKTAITWIALVVVGTILGIGISWSHIRRKLTGQLDTDDLED